MSVEPQGLFARLYLDEDIHKLVAEAMRLRGFDVVSVFEAGLCGLDDSEQLAHAATEHRAIVTFNIADYVKLHLEYLASGKEHYGIILSEQISIGEIIRRLLALLNKFTADELKNNLWWLQG